MSGLESAWLAGAVAFGAGKSVRLAQGFKIFGAGVGIRKNLLEL